MTGGAAVGAASQPGVIVLALLVFLWTPVHFWALAMFYRDDYAAGDIPMLPVHVSPERSARWILVHAISTGLATVLLAVDPALGWPFLIPAVLISLMLIVGSMRLIQNPEKRQAIRLFIQSNLFLAGVLLATILVPLGRQLFFS
jgi:protoheme IX farnesyltransferase